MDTKRMRDAANEQLTRVGMRTEDLVRWRQEAHPEKVLALLDENNSLRAELAATRRELERWRHSEQIEGDYVCPAEQLLEQRDEVIRERDSLRAEVEGLRDLAAHHKHQEKEWRDNYDGSQEQLAAARAALRKAIGIAEQLVRHHGDYFNCRYRLSELSMVARDD